MAESKTGFETKMAESKTGFETKMEESKTSFQKIVAECKEMVSKKAGEADSKQSDLVLKITTIQTELKGIYRTSRLF